MATTNTAKLLTPLSKGAPTVVPRTSQQRVVLMKMHREGSRRNHHVRKLGTNVRVLDNLVRQGFVMYARCDFLGYTGKLTARGRAAVRAMLDGKPVVVWEEPVW